MPPAPIWASSRYRPLSCIPTSVLISSALLWPIWRCRRRCSRIPARLRRSTGVHLRDRQVAPDDSGRRVSTPTVGFAGGPRALLRVDRAAGPGAPVRPAVAVALVVRGRSFGRLFGGRSFGRLLGR